MIKIINELDIRKASDTKRCQIIIGIIQGKFEYQNKQPIEKEENTINEHR